jgi:multiple sugar transport system permease protein
MKSSTSNNIKMSVAYTLTFLMCIMFLLPFYWMIRSSLMDARQLFIYPIKLLPNPVRWENYPNALKSQPFLKYFRNTVFLVVMNMAGTMLTSAMAGYAFSRLQWRGKKIMFYALLSTMMIPGFVTLLPTFLVWSKLRLTSTYWPLILPSWLGGGAYNIFLTRQFFMTIPRELDEAALIDGANQWMIFWRILIPLIKPVLAVLGVFTFMGVWNDLLGPIIYLNNENMYTLSVALSSFRSIYGTKWDFLMSASALVTLPMVIVFFSFQRYFIEGVTLTGIKG